MSKVIHEGSCVRFINTDHPEDLAYFLRYMATSLGESPPLEVTSNEVVINCQDAPQMLRFLEGCRDGRLVPVLEGDTAYFRERGPIN